MTRIIITSSQREAPIQTSSGWVYILDLEQQRILKKSAGTEPPYRFIDRNPRGGMRGMKGLSINGGELAIADYSAVYFFDRNWTFLRAFTHPSVAAIHEILYVNDGLWVTSAANDLLVKYDLNGKLKEFYSLREQTELMLQLGGSPRRLLNSENIIKAKQDFRRRSYFISDLHDRLHVNGLALSPDGRIFLSFGLVTGDYFVLLRKIKNLMKRINLWDYFVLFNRLIRNVVGLNKYMLSEMVFQPIIGTSAVVSLGQETGWQSHLHFPIAQNPSHSIRVLENGTCLYLATSHGSIVHFDVNGEVLSNTKITDKFMRGLLVLPQNQLLIGADNSIITYDLTTNKKLNELEITEDRLDTVFGIDILPDDFNFPPDSLQKRIGNIVGFDGDNIVLGNSVSGL